MKPLLVLITHVENKAVTQGFVPAAISLGYDVCLLTDHGLDHKQFFSTVELGPEYLFECDVFNPLAIIDSLKNRQLHPQVVFSNSDHLQACTAVVADYFSCPAKNWQACYQAKNKAEMRSKLSQLSLPNVWTHHWNMDQNLPSELVFPVIAKPREGVASMDVTLCENKADLMAYASSFGRNDAPILLEAYLEGPLFTLETLGDGKAIQMIGGFDVALSPLPHFIEKEAIWNGPVGLTHREAALAQIVAFGINFGVCHSEFILTEKGPILVEINYRSIGDGREFLLNELLPFDWFEAILSLHAGQNLPPLETQTQQALIRYFPTTASGVIESGPETFSLESDLSVVHFKTLKQTGERIHLSHSNKDYLGMLTAIGRSQSQLQTLANDIENNLNWKVS
ncbi:ATP-grasp domain-containing protein [Shewanella surugensis]|uniref:ATP-grasp domain-containing protein n=1 Tax=Shewanella surugensis TaxID=212020 RepID=A0ABT0LCK6_9GAMM|nr:hypothetical protein [Shewanella surugensis]MCL1125422.1 hypothetical protein [Shewanella surugensis]